MVNGEYIKRVSDAKIAEYLETFGAVCVEGPKWCGKTWSSAMHCKSSFYLGDPGGNFANRRLVEISPDIVMHGEPPHLLDEWQEYPPLWDAVRHWVDRSGAPGQFILTGSATPVHKGILHSGAGRIGRMRMRTMSLYESGDSSGQVSLQELSEGKFTPALTGEVELKRIVHLIVRGGWPGALQRKGASAYLLPQQYLRAVLDDDVYRMDGTHRDPSKMHLLLRSLARNVATEVSIKTLRKDVQTVDNEDLEDKTIAAYLDVFRRLFLTENLPPFASNVRSSVRIKQTEKRYFCDPSLACALLKIKENALMRDLNTLGFLFENLCVRDLLVYADAMNAQVFHYRDYKGNEIDAVLELEDGSWMAIEIKLGAAQIDSAAAGLIKLRDAIAADPSGRPPAALVVICALSNAAYRRPDGVYVLPITALRP